MDWRFQEGPTDVESTFSTTKLSIIFVSHNFKLLCLEVNRLACFCVAGGLGSWSNRPLCLFCPQAPGEGVQATVGPAEARAAACGASTLRGGRATCLTVMSTAGLRRKEAASASVTGTEASSSGRLPTGTAVYWLLRPRAPPGPGPQSVWPPSTACSIGPCAVFRSWTEPRLWMRYVNTLPLSPPRSKRASSLARGIVWCLSSRRGLRVATGVGSSYSTELARLSPRLSMEGHSVLTWLSQEPVMLPFLVLLAQRNIRLALKLDHGVNVDCLISKNST